ncbi:MAG TPA: beta-ketoacyl-[acyl-carrier-protein] synthase family protein [Polyangiaceae bacterium]|nr:beta-ketoacyl-[acyl-carrier-protein] synthase family protein [Polyangiaceae bacterium]
MSGVGLVSALGQSAAETFRALMTGERGLAPIGLFDPGDVRSRLVGEVRGLRATDVAGRSGAELSRTDLLAVAAAREAVAHARLPKAARLGVVLGGTTGGMFETEALLSNPEELAKISAARAAELVSYPMSASLSRVAEAVGGVERTRSICSACSGGAIALLQAVAWLSRGEVDFVLAGGADGLCRLTVLGFNALGATDPAPSRPFDRARAGLNLGEGAAVLVLEREQTALERGADVLAWLDGYAVGAEAHHITHPEPSGARAVQLLRSALERAGLSPADVGYVNAHGTGTQHNDAMEARALLEVLGEGSATLISSSKAQLGHTLGAAGAIEAALTVLAVSRSEVPPTAGLSEPELPGLRHVMGRGRSEPLAAALSSSFGFGGMSCVLAFTASQRPAPPSAPPPPRVAVLSAAVLDASDEPQKSLDEQRSRRFDRASAQAAAGALRTLGASPPAETGLVLGTAFGNVERTMAFLERGRERGARLVAPAEFPHLVPSAPAGNASVYAGLAGPVFAVSDLAQSGDAAFATACELLELGVASRVIAGAIAPRDAIVDRVLGPLLDSPGAGLERGEGAAFTLLGSVEQAKAQGTLLAEVLARRAGLLVVGAGLPDLPALGTVVRRAVVLGAADVPTRRELSRSSWAKAPIIDVVVEQRHHEALGAQALALAAQALQRGELEQALVLSGGNGKYSAVLLGRGTDAEP